MATNPLIPLMSEVPKTDLFGSFLRGVDYKDSREDRARAKELQPMEDRLNKLKMDAAEQNLETGASELGSAETDEAIRLGAMQYDLATTLRQLPEEQRAAAQRVWEEQQGIPDDGIQDPVDNAFLDNVIAGTYPYAQQALGKSKARPIGVPVLTQDENGTKYFAQQMTDGRGNISVVRTPVAGDIVDRKGQDASARVAEAGEKAAVTQNAQTEGFEDRREVEQETAAGIAEQSATGSGIAARRNEAIEFGLDQAKGIPVLNRGIELMGFIKTGGFEAARIRAKQALGIESGDEGELANLLGKAVLGQLRSTFGAQFTQEEGQRLEGIEARLGANAETNLRLLQNAKQTAEEAAKRGIKAAVEAEDYSTAQDIKDMMTSTLGEGSSQIQEGAIAEDAQGNRIQFINGKWQAI